MPACFFHWARALFTVIFLFSLLTSSLFLSFCWSLPHPHPPTRMLTGCYWDTLSHLILRKKRTQSSTKAEVNCTVGDISQYFQGREHLWLRVADDKQGSSLSPLVNLYCARMSVAILRHEDWKKTNKTRPTRLQNCIHRTLKEHKFVWRSSALDRLLCNVFNQSHISKPAPPAGPWEPSQWKHAGRDTGS